MLGIEVEIMLNFKTEKRKMCYWNQLRAADRREEKLLHHKIFEWISNK